MQLPTLGALIEYLHLHAHAQNVDDTITQWLSNASQLSLPLYQQYILLLLTLPILFFMLRPHSAGEDLYYMAIPMLSFCDDFHDHIAWNVHVLKHVKGYFRAMFHATRNAHSRIQPGYWHIIPVVMSGTVLCIGTVVEIAISTTCAVAMIAVLIATTLLARDWRLQTVDWLDEGILQVYRHTEETVERTFLDAAYWAGLWMSDVVIAVLNGRQGKGGAGTEGEARTEQWVKA